MGPIPCKRCVKGMKLAQNMIPRDTRKTRHARQPHQCDPQTNNTTLTREHQSQMHWTVAKKCAKNHSKRKQESLLVDHQHNWHNIQRKKKGWIHKRTSKNKTRRKKKKKPGSTKHWGIHNCQTIAFRENKKSSWHSWRFKTFSINKSDYCPMFPMSDQTSIICPKTRFKMMQTNIKKVLTKYSKAKFDVSHDIRKWKFWKSKLGQTNGGRIGVSERNLGSTG